MAADVETVATAGASALGAGALVVWWTKLLMQRMVNQYDTAHTKHEAKFERIAAKLSSLSEDVRSKLAAIEVRAAEGVAMKQDVKEITKELAVIRHEQEKLRGDVNIAHHRLRQVVPPRS